MSSELYQKSNYLRHVMSDNGRVFVYHTLFNNPIEVSDSILKLINSFSEAKNIDHVCHDFQGDFQEIVNLLIHNYYIYPATRDERDVLEYLQQNFLEKITTGVELGRLELAISNACNFGCKHCMHFLNNNFDSRISRSMHMSIGTAKKSIDIFVDKVKKNNNNSVRVHFGNGEPLMNWKTLIFALEYCESIKDIEFSYAINTNLSLLNREKAEVLKMYNVKISTSLDGLKEANDSIRVDRQGHGTFEKIIEKIKLLKSIDYPIDGFSITVTDKNFHLIDESIIDFAKKLEVKDVSMDFDLVRSTHISTDDCVAMIIKLRRYAHQKNLNFYGTWETPYRNLMSNSWLSSPYSFCPALEGKTLEFNVDGSLKTCGHTNTVIGHSDRIDECFLPDSQYLQLINNRLPGNNEFCKGCDLEGCCAGHCHVTLESSINDQELVNNMCQLMIKTTKSLIHEYLQGR